MVPVRYCQSATWRRRIAAAVILTSRWYSTRLSGTCALRNDPLFAAPFQRPGMVRPTKREADMKRTHTLDQSSAHDVSRRTFLKNAATFTGALTIAVYLPGCSKPEEATLASGPAKPNAWLHIGADSKITFLCDRSEMGQGVYTAFEWWRKIGHRTQIYSCRVCAAGCRVR